MYGRTRNDIVIVYKAFFNRVCVIHAMGGE